jgi:surfeit locus 1 family protein
MNLQTYISSKGFIGLTFVTFSIILVCVWLGFWQIQRLHWKENLLFSLTDSDSAPFEPIEHIIANGQNISIPNLKKVHLKGVFRHDLEIKLIPRTFKGKSGAHLLTPLVLPFGKLVMINRGWIPDNLDHNIPISRSSEEVEISGFIRHPYSESKITPANEPTKGLWFTVNLTEISPFLRQSDKNLNQEMLSFYVMQKPNKNYKGYPIPIDLPSTLPNHHLQYAYTWFFLAFGLILGYIGYVRIRSVYQ